MQSVKYGGSGAGNWNTRKFQVPWPSHVFMSKTRSGLCYKEDDTKYTKDTMAELKVQELLQMLIEDRTKREVEIAEKRERREKEFDAERRRRDEERERETQKREKEFEAERRRRDEEREARERESQKREKEFEAERQRRDEEREATERESQKRLDQMQAYMDNLLKLVEGTTVQRS